MVGDIKKMKIGRPATYANMISKVQERGYAEHRSTIGKVDGIQILELTDQLIQSQKEINLGAAKNKLMPTELGISVNDYLCNHFSNIIDYNFTARMELELDKIANGKSNWVTVVSIYYQAFHPIVVQLNAVTPNIKYTKVSKRLVGIDIATGFPMLSYKSKNGPVLQIGGDELPREQRKYINITLKQIKTLTEIEGNALKRYPIQLGMYKNQMVLINNGKHGEYIKCGKLSANLKEGSDTLTLEKAIVLLTKKKSIVVKQFKNGTVVMIGEFGPFIAYKGKCTSIPKSIVPATITLKKCKELLKKKK